MGSFAAAARKLNSSRSRISEKIAQLEALLEVRLLQRSTRQLKITAEGQLIYEQARQLPLILQNIEAITLPSEPSGRVAITMNHDIAHKYLLPILADFQQQYPNVQLDLILDDARLDLIGEDIDLGIRIGAPKDESLIARIMHEERFIICANPDYLRQNPIPDDIAALADLHWIIMSPNNESPIQRFRQNDKIVELRPKQFYRCNSPLMVQQMVRQGLGLGCLLPSTVQTEMNAGEIVPIMPELMSDPLVFSLIYPSRRQVPQRTRVVIDYLLNANMFTA